MAGFQDAVGGALGSTVAIGEIEGATLVTAAETIAANNNDTTFPTSAAVKGYADGVTALSALGTVSTGLTGVLRADAGVLSVDSDVTNIVDNIAVSQLADGTDGELITWSAAGAPTTVAVGAATHVLTSNGAGAAPTFQAVPMGGVLAENSSIGLDPAGSADGKFTGITVTATSGYAQAFGDLVYLDPTDSRWEATDANAASGADGDSRGILGMVVVAGTDGNACTILLNGIIRADAALPAMTINAPFYVSETAGDITSTAPTTTDAVVRTCGYALTADELYFNPASYFQTAV